MDFEAEQEFVAEIKRYISENLPLSKMSDEELEEKVEDIVGGRIGEQYCSIEQRVSIVQQVYSSIRGLKYASKIRLARKLNVISDDEYKKTDINKIKEKIKDKKVEEQWASTDPTVTNNKSLTNQMINSTNNYAYGGEIEYIISGDDNSVSKICSSIYLIRFALNTPAAFMTFYPTARFIEDGEIARTYTMIHATADALAAATGGVIPAPLTRIVLIMAEIAIESGQDMKYLKAGLPVKLIKTKDDSAWGSKKNCENTAVCLTYRDYIYIFTLLAFKSEKANGLYARVGDVIQANMRHRLGDKGKNYALSKSVTHFKLEATLRVKPLMLALPVADGLSDNPKNRTDWCTFTYKIQRGY